MVIATLIPQQLNTTLAGMDLPTHLHHAATGDDDDTAGGFHWVGLVILLLKLLPLVLAIAGYVYSKTRRGAASTSSTYAANRPVIAPWQPAPTQPPGGYIPHSRPVAPWQPTPDATAARWQPPTGAAWQAAPACPPASAHAPYSPVVYR